MASRLLDGLSHFVIAIEVKYVGNEVEGILVVLDFCVKPSQVESIGEVVLVDLAEVFVSARGDKLGTRN